MRKNKKDQQEKSESLQLLKEMYPFIGSAISLELEHGNYDSIEKLKVLRKKIEKLIA
jgi:hypothetical protein